MDFASLMKSQISASKSKQETSGSKYQRKGEAEARRQAEYEAEQRVAEAKRLEAYEKKRKLEEEEAERDLIREQKRQRIAEESKRIKTAEKAQEERENRARLGLPDLPAQLSESEINGEEKGEDAETVINELRKLNEPITLFGETKNQRLKRWYKLTGKDKANKPVLTDGPIPTTLVPVPEVDMKIPAKAPKDTKERQFLFRQLASYFTMLLEEWISAMSKRTDQVKSSQQGRIAYNAMIMAKENLRPLFKKMESGQLDDAIVDAIVEIVHAAQERRYVDANDAYLRVSIGKAAWPIGVTMVGIHERSAREKLHESDKTAHIMGDELTRKYLQSIKRCLSFAQTRWPPDDLIQLMG